MIQIVPVRVDYSRITEELFRAGRYDNREREPYINQRNFPPRKTGKHLVQVQLLPLDKKVDGLEAQEEIRERGYAPIDTHTVLSIGEQFPELQKSRKIIALGQTWTDPEDKLELAVWIGLVGIGRVAALTMVLAHHAYDKSSLFGVVTI